jgi:preprotein translocase subunit YajC
MTSAHAAVTALLAASSSTTTTTSGNSLITLLPLVIIFGLAYFLFLRPRAQAARRQRDTVLELSAGDEVLTGAGIFGTVLDVESDRVTLETAPGTRITVLRSTIARRITDTTAMDAGWDDRDEDEAHDAYHDYEHEHEHDEHDPQDEHDPHDEHDEHDEHDDDADAHDGADVHADGAVPGGPTADGTDADHTDADHTDAEHDGDTEERHTS